MASLSPTAVARLHDAVSLVLAAVTADRERAGAAGRIAAVEGIDRLRDGLIAALQGDEAEVLRLASVAAARATRSLSRVGPRAPHAETGTRPGAAGRGA